ncbi:MAG: MOSC domain-containing protein [Pirellulaceae bacterium]
MTAPSLQARVIAVCSSPGGIPKLPLEEAAVDLRGIQGDGHSHAKHDRPDRALSLFDLEVLRALVAEGFPLQPGTAGENITVEGLHVQGLPPGTLLKMGDVVMRLEQPRKPCYVLDAVHPDLQRAIVGRCGYLASVIRPGCIRPGMAIAAFLPGSNDVDEVTSA